MPKNANELRADRAAVIAEARKIVDKATAETRDLTAEETEKFDNYMRQADEFGRQVVTAERSEALAAAEAELRGSAGRRVPAAAPRQGSRVLDADQAAELVRAWALAEDPTRQPDPDLVFRAADAGFNVNGRTMSYSRALSKGTTTAGGHTVPQSFSSELEKVLAYFFLVGEAVSQFNTDNGQDYPWPTVTDTANASGIVAEAGAVGTTTDPTFGQIVYKSWDYFSPIVKVSYQLLRDSAQNIPSVLAELFAERMGRALDAAIVSSNAGTAAPEGLLNGVSAGVNLASGNAITFAKLLALETSVDLAYRSQPGCGHLMHDATWQAIRALADSTGRPLVNMDIQNGVERRLLGYPVFISNNMTSIASAGDNTVHILFGALKKYKVRRIGGSTLTRLNELYAGNGQVGFVLHEAYDGRWITKAGVKTLNAEDTA